MSFVYLSGVQAFLSDRIDENPNYSDSIRVFEFTIGRDKTKGEPLKKFLPVSVRIFKAIVPRLETLVFSYYFERRKTFETIKVINVKFLKEILS